MRFPNSVPLPDGGGHYPDVSCGQRHCAPPRPHPTGGGGGVTSQLDTPGSRPSRAVAVSQTAGVPPGTLRLLFRQSRKEHSYRQRDDCNTQKEISNKGLFPALLQPFHRDDSDGDINIDKYADHEYLTQIF